MTLRLPTFLTVPRKPDFIIGEEDAPYLRRWHVIPRNRWFNIYLHNFLHSDDDRALHDHMYVNYSVLLRGQYLERLKDGEVRTRSAPGLVFRRPATSHRVELFGGDNPQPVWTLFITGPRVREWGFICDGGRWVHWKDFTRPDKPGSIGPGCG